MLRIDIDDSVALSAAWVAIRLMIRNVISNITLRRTLHSVIVLTYASECWAM